MTKEDSGDSAEQPDQRGKEGERQRRQDALSQIAHEHGSVEPGTNQSIVHQRTPPRWWKPRPSGRPVRKRWQALLAALVLASGVIGLVIHFLPTANPAPRSHTQPLEITPWADKLDCPRDVAWAPDGKMLAILGYQGDCPVPAGPAGGNAAASGLVNIYDISGKTMGYLTRQLHPDNAVLQALQVPTSVTTHLMQICPGGPSACQVATINYTHILWSPDGQHVALTFSMLVPIAPPVPGTEHSDWTRVLENGVILLDATKSAVPRTPQVLIQPTDNQTVKATEWDLTTGTAIPSAGITQASPFSTLPPALSYSWGAAGALVPQTPLPVAATQGSPPLVPLSPIGIPNGGASFTIWQPGLTATTIPRTATQPSVSGIFEWSTSIAAWSPDGRYLIEALDLSGLLVSAQTPAPSASSLNASGLGQAPLLPVRDAALQAAYPIVQTSPFFGGPDGFMTNGVLLAWRPDGRYLAIDAHTADRHLALYNCQTGRLVATLHPYITNIPSVGYVSKQQNEANVVRWSPDGSQLLLLDTQLGTATIWGSQQLPR